MLKEVVLNILDLVLKKYRSLVDDKNALSTNLSTNNQTRKIITQNQALQILFDLKFMFIFFDIKSIGLATSSSFSSDHFNDEKLAQLAINLNDEFKNVTELFESFVDPFDYDICMPFIQSNVLKCIARTTVCKNAIKCLTLHLCYSKA